MNTINKDKLSYIYDHILNIIWISSLDPKYCCIHLADKCKTIDKEKLLNRYLKLSKQNISASSTVYNLSRAMLNEMIKK